MPQLQRRQRQQDKQSFDTYYIIKFFCLWFVFALIALGVKAIVMRALQISPTGQVGNGTLTLYEVHNSGAAFNLFANQSDLIIIASMFTVLIIAFVIIFASNKLNQTMVSALAFLNAGITMNLLDRLKDGYVTDYIHCNFMPSLPVFNVPDIMIVIGTICLILGIFTKR